MGNYSESSKDELTKKYGMYLIDGEEITSGYTLIRDAIVFTDRRIIFLDHQGATEKKTSVKSIYLMNIIDVEMETAGAGMDDSEIEITFLKNVKRKAHSESFDSMKFEFPKRLDIVPLYRFLINLAYNNRLEINSGE